MPPWNALSLPVALRGLPLVLLLIVVSPLSHVWNAPVVTAELAKKLNTVTLLLVVCVTDPLRYAPRPN